ncbi:hypothetical protein RRG08_020438 [Elysia crispata]|uniref:Uncharacterized protein n=1 Tax=Elysia crispata TaxID=231223 RepID=A0AAE1B4V3_9GAST|nr:hypothetical protein RRG08_020438 [Elysia crispata]
MRGALSWSLRLIGLSLGLKETHRKLAFRWTIFLANWEIIDSAAELPIGHISCLFSPALHALCVARANWPEAVVALILRANHGLKVLLQPHFCRPSTNLNSAQRLHEWGGKKRLIRR